VEEVQPERVKLSLRLGQSRALYDGFKVQKFMSSSEKQNTSEAVCAPQTHKEVPLQLGQSRALYSGFKVGQTKVQTGPTQGNAPAMCSTYQMV